MRGNGDEASGGRTAVERLLEERRMPDDPVGGRLGRDGLLRERSLEGYLQAAGRPRWMQRLMDVEGGIARETARLDAAHRALREACGADDGAFARRWRATVESWPFDAQLKELIAQHNAWYPIERDLPMDPRTGDYVRVHGRCFRRPVLDAAWALERFPA